MNKLEYIPGDLVMVKKSALQFAKDKTFRVISSLSGGFVKVVMLNDSSTTYSISNNSVRPIPLTPEILEKNGWGKDYCIGNEDRYAKYDFLYISYYRNDNTTKLFVKGLTLLSNIKYVHQLQHLLFGLGLSMDLKV